MSLYDPPMKQSNGRGRPGVDWDALEEMWIKQTDFDSLEKFLMYYGIDVDQKRTRQHIKNWVRIGSHAKLTYEQAKNNQEQIKRDIEEKERQMLAERKRLVEKEVELLEKEKDIVTIESENYAAKVERVSSMIRAWRAMQAEKDYRAADKLRQVIEEKSEELSKILQTGGYVKTYDLINLANALEKVQRIQRLSLGMSTDNVGIEDARKLAEEQAGDVGDSTPVFAVEVNENGKFTRLRPRRVN